MTNADYSPELRATLNRLFSLQTFGIKLGLEPVTELLDQFGNPHHRFPCIHVAGTNGKGSVCAMVASVLQSAGLRVGLYSSPHLVRFQERIRMNGIPMPVEHLARYTTQMMPAIERLGSTFFEGTTAMAFRYFAEQEVDVAVIETGMGGRLDATNVVAPLATAITSISFDHTKHLGETLEAIAFEKAGIIKGGARQWLGALRRDCAPCSRSVPKRLARRCCSLMISAAACSMTSPSTPPLPPSC
ncbi:MAG: Folylpolyglutamate synthase [Chlorobi bacterium OLB7]|nr:MAG: Folylpolyglutamate synthase [Chlorobi bacterium OLB7]